MDALFTPTPSTSFLLPETLSLKLLLHLGLDYVQREDYPAAVAVLALARRQVPPQQHELAAVLDTFLQSYQAYRQIQQTLFEVSRQFAQEYGKQQAHAADVARVLPQLLQDMHATSDAQSAIVPPLTGSIVPSSLGNTTFVEQVEFPPSRLPVSPLSTLTTTSVPHDDPVPAAHFSITCFGRFEVRRGSTPVMLCASRNGQSIFRYLISRPDHAATTETLQAVFWPDDAAPVAQRKLHTAMSALRRSLKSGSADEQRAEWEYIVYKQRIYALAATTSIETDVDHFLRYYTTGQQRSDVRIECYEAACRYYTGPFLVEERYADWSFLQREQLGQIYLTMCRVLATHYLQVKRYEPAIQWATILLRENQCDEDAHRLLIQIYAAQGRRSEALQYYHRCVRILHEALGVQPLPETQALYTTLQSSADALGEQR